MMYPILQQLFPLLFRLFFFLFCFFLLVCVLSLVFALISVLLFLLFLLAELSALSLVALGVAVLHLVVDEVVQRDDGADERGQVDHQHLVVGLDVDGLDELLQVDVGQQVKDVLQLVDDLVVDGQLPGAHLLQVAVDILDLQQQALQTHQLVRHALRQSTNRRVLDIPITQQDTCRYRAETEYQPSCP